MTIDVQQHTLRLRVCGSAIIVMKWGKKYHLDVFTYRIHRVVLESYPQ